jgi:CheY-like chemotaxis protein
MPRVLVVHWRAEDAEPALEVLRKGGFDAALAGADGARAIRAVREQQPAAVVIDLSRLPSHGREVAIELRKSAKTRQIPLIFLGGAPEKVDAIRALMPDASYCDIRELAKTVRAAIRNKPEAPVQPLAMMDRYKGRSVAQKLGIQAGSRVAVFDAPRDYAQILSSAPEGVEFQEDDASGCDIVLWFVREQNEFDARVRTMARQAAKAKLWVVWPKGKSTKTGAASENLIREAAIAAGLVDYKVCAVDERWSGLALCLRRASSVN